MKLTAQEKANNAIKWIDTLEKTRFKQSTRALGDKHSGFCCLGLGCYLMKIEYDPERSYNKEFQKTVGLSYKSGKLKNNESFDEYYNQLDKLNDVLNLSFNEISKEIKKHLKDLFIPNVSKILIEHYSK